MPELIQDAASPAMIADRLDEMLNNAQERNALEARFADMHCALQRNASQRAAQAITSLVAGQPLDSDAIACHNGVDHRRYDWTNYPPLVIDYRGDFLSGR